MRYLLFLITALFLTSCGGDVAEGLSAKNAAAYTEIVSEIKADRKALEAQAELEGAPVPPAFRRAAPCSFVPRAAALAFNPQLTFDPVGVHTTDEGSTDYAVKHGMNCSYNNLAGMQEALANDQLDAYRPGSIVANISFNGFGNRGIFEAQEPYYEEVNVSGLDRTLVNKAGNEIIGLKGNYSITLHSLVDGTNYDIPSIGTDKVHTLLRTIAAELPE